MKENWIPKNTRPGIGEYPVWGWHPEYGLVVIVDYDHDRESFISSADLSAAWLEGEEGLSVPLAALVDYEIISTECGYDDDEMIEWWMPMKPKPMLSNIPTAGPPEREANCAYDCDPKQILRDTIKHLEEQLKKLE